jgi:hypothetical protein
MNSLNYFLKEPKKIPIGLLYKLGSWLPDKFYLKLLFPLLMDYKLDLKNPKTFAEKCQWLKLYDRKLIYHQMVDKYEAKQLAASMIGEEHVIPTFGIWDNVNDIDWYSLPDKFVVKPTHIGGGVGVVICRNKLEFDIEKAKIELSKALNMNLYPRYREWQYKDVKPRIIAEELLEDNTCPYLRDYKFYCFNGEPKLFYITSDKGISETRQDFYDIQGNHLELEDVHYPNNQTATPKLPKNLEKMVFLSKILSANIPHMRVDLYEIDDKIYFGEWTFFEGGGFVSFRPDCWNLRFGDWINLSEKN